MKFFVDTNVIVYSRDGNAPGKRDRAINWLTVLASDGAIVISPQVINESINAFINKLKLEHSVLAPFVDGMARWCTGASGVAVTERAIHIRDRWKFEWWDCLIVASAASSGCDYLLTEDLQDGQKLDAVEVVDPFIREPATFSLR